MKKIISFLIWAAAFTLLPVSTANAQSTTCTATPSTGTVTIAGYSGTAEQTGRLDVNLSCTTTTSAGIFVVFPPTYNMAIRLCVYAGGVPRELTLETQPSVRLPYLLKTTSGGYELQPWPSGGAAANQSATMSYAASPDRYIPFVGWQGTATATATIPLTITVPASNSVSSGTYSTSYATTLLDFSYSVNTNGSVPNTCNGTSSKWSSGFAIRVPVLNTCSISSATNMDFGSLASTSVNGAMAQSTVTMTCTKGTAWSLSMDPGKYPSGGIRRMKHATLNEYISYDLYRDSGRTLQWTSADSQSLKGTATDTNVIAIPVFGSVAPNQDPAVGSYADTIRVTITY